MEKVITQEIETNITGVGIRFFVGLTTQHGEEIAKGEAIKKISEILVKNGVLGATFKENIGMWKGEVERSLEIYFINTFGVDESTIKAIAKEVKGALDQESVLVVYDVAPHEFI